MYDLEACFFIPREADFQQGRIEVMRIHIVQGTHKDVCGALGKINSQKMHKGLSADYHLIRNNPRRTVEFSGTQPYEGW